jgi:hypothetical protein
MYMLMKIEQLHSKECSSFTPQCQRCWWRGSFGGLNTYILSPLRGRESINLRHGDPMNDGEAGFIESDRQEKL